MACDKLLLPSYIHTHTLTGGTEHGAECGPAVARGDGGESGRAGQEEPATGAGDHQTTPPPPTGETQN